MSTFLSHEERTHIIRSYAQRYSLKTFVETGTGEGFTTQHLLDDFTEMWTVELDPELYQRALVMFYNRNHVHCVLGDSTDELPKVVEHLIYHGTPALFWLDGHYCGGARGDIDTPIRVELKSALKAPWGSVILVDDARLFEGGSEHTEEFKDYPSLDWVYETGIEHGYRSELIDDVIRLTPV